MKLTDEPGPWGRNANSHGWELDSPSGLRFERPAFLAGPAALEGLGVIGTPGPDAREVALFHPRPDGAYDCWHAVVGPGADITGHDVPHTVASPAAEIGTVADELILMGSDAVVPGPSEMIGYVLETYEEAIGESAREMASAGELEPEVARAWERSCRQDGRLALRYIEDKAGLWDDLGRYAAAFITPEEVRDVSKGMGIELEREGIDPEDVAFLAAENFGCNLYMDDLVQDQIEAEISNLMKLHGKDPCAMSENEPLCDQMSTAQMSTGEGRAGAALETER